MKKETLKKLFMILCLIGVLVSVYLIYNHYAIGDSACDISADVSCSYVNSSIYSELFNVPVAVFGALWFVFMYLFFVKNADSHLLEIWSVLGVLFVIYMIVAEFLLGAICPFCTVVHVIVLMLFYLVFWQIQFKGKKHKFNVKKFLSKNKKWIVAVGIVYIIFALVFQFDFTISKEDYTEAAKCINDKGVNMYGSFRCGVCAKTRSMFGDAFENINEIECHPQGENPQVELCVEKGIEGTPTWILEPNGVEEKRHLGFLDVDELKEFAGCE